MTDRPDLSKPTGLPPLKFIDPLWWQDKEIPERQWLVPDLIPMRQVTLLAGDGGLGKSILSLSLQASTSLTRTWLGQQVRPVKSIGVYCEDEEDELHRRLAAICRHHDAELGDLEHLMLLSRVGQNNSLVEWENQWAAGESTAFFVQLMNYAIDFGAQLVVLDSLHDLFPGNENSRPHARQFIGELRTLATEINGAVVLTAHPSLTGRNTGTGEAGSTAWSNAVRSRLYLTKAEERTDGAERILSTKKANYSGGASDIRLRWREGVYEHIPDDPSMVGSIRRANAEKTFMACLDIVAKQGRHVTDAPNSPRFAPRQFAELPETNGFDIKDLKGAMNSLFASGRIRIGTALGADRHKVKAIVKGDDDQSLQL